MNRAQTGPTSTAAAALVVVLVLGAGVAGCSDPAPDATQRESTPATRSPAPGSGMPSPSRTATAEPEDGAAREGEAPGDLPAIPPRPPRSAAELARHLNRAEHLIRAPGADGDSVRAAGEFTQLSARALADADRPFRRRVLRRLDPVAAEATRANLAASRELHAITDPQRTLPEWRIVEPPAPATLRRYYRLAERRSGVPWHYLAAIHLVETRMGRIRGTSSAGARGPMQFLPTTWEIYGEGGDIRDPRDAILAAGRLLEAHGAPEDMADALWHYNPSDSYVRAVSAYARVIRRSPEAYRGYWHWRVLYRHVDGTYALPVGYPRTRPVLVEPAAGPGGR
jgi:soluble lytic murein transglycosylase-like protein